MSNKLAIFKQVSHNAYAQFLYSLGYAHLDIKTHETKQDSEWITLATLKGYDEIVGRINEFANKKTEYWINFSTAYEHKILIED